MIELVASEKNGHWMEQWKKNDLLEGHLVKLNSSKIREAKLIFGWKCTSTRLIFNEHWWWEKITTKEIYLYLDDDQGCDSGCGLLLTLINSFSPRWLAQYGNARSLLLSLASRRPQEVYRCYTSQAASLTACLDTACHAPLWPNIFTETLWNISISKSLSLLRIYWLLSLDKRSRGRHYDSRVLLRWGESNEWDMWPWASGGRAPMPPGALSVLVSHIVPAAQQMLSLSAPFDQS